MKNDQETMHQLETLLSRTVNAREAYKNASKNVHNKPLTVFFEDAANKHDGFANQIKQKIQQMGGNTGDKTSLKSEADRFWLDFASIIVRRNESAILKACARAEKDAIDQYDQALDMEQLEEGVREEIRSQRDYANDLLNEVDELLKQYSSD
jgi:uncharacterized protein (TIGR02284 family)